jgi:3-oxoacyl-(acyl-carrier-protein) synthase
MCRPVVVTGVGAVSAFGWGAHCLEPTFKGVSAIAPYCVSALPGASEVWAARLASGLPLGVFDRRIEDADRVVQMAAFAAREAVLGAGLDARDTGLVAWGTGYGGAATMDEAYTRWLFGRDTLTGKVSPLTVPKAMTHASAASVAACFGLECPVMTYSCACASSAVAIGEAMLAIAHGRCDVAIVGGSEALIVPGVVKAWEALGALAKSDPQTPHAAWHGPFDQMRNGLVLGEGAACLVLESHAHAHARGAQVLAHCLGYAQVNDPECITHPNAAPQLRAMHAALLHAGVRPDQVSYVNAHATGTRAGDASEIEALNALFQTTQAAVSSTKGATGHLMGAAGAMEAILSIHALRTKQCPPNIAVRQLDSQIRFSAPVQATALPPHGICLSNSFAFGGTNVSLVFKAHD